MPEIALKSHADMLESQGEKCKRRMLWNCGQPGGAGYKAQNNTQSIITDPDTISRFTAELIAEHMAAQHAAVAAMNDPTKTSSLKMPIKKL